MGTDPPVSSRPPVIVDSVQLTRVIGQPVSVTHGLWAEAIPSGLSAGSSQHCSCLPAVGAREGKQDSLKRRAAVSNRCLIEVRRWRQ